MMPSPPPIRIGAEQLAPNPLPIKDFDEGFSPSPPPIMPRDIFQSQLQALRDMEITLRQSSNQYKQLNSSMLSGRIQG